MEAEQLAGQRRLHLGTGQVHDRNPQRLCLPSPLPGLVGARHGIDALVSRILGERGDPPTGRSVGIPLVKRPAAPRAARRVALLFGGPRSRWRLDAPGVAPGVFLLARDQRLGWEPPELPRLLFSNAGRRGGRSPLIGMLGADAIEELHRGEVIKVRTTLEPPARKHSPTMKTDPLD